VHVGKIVSKRTRNFGLSKTMQSYYMDEGRCPFQAACARKNILFMKIFMIAHGGMSMQ
jgi:hypothetical protein